MVNGESFPAPGRAQAAAAQAGGVAAWKGIEQERPWNPAGSSRGWTSSVLLWRKTSMLGDPAGSGPGRRRALLCGI